MLMFKKDPWAKSFNPNYGSHGPQDSTSRLRIVLSSQNWENGHGGFPSLPAFLLFVFFKLWTDWNPVVLGVGFFQFFFTVLQTSLSILDGMGLRIRSRAESSRWDHWLFKVVTKDCAPLLCVISWGAFGKCCHLSPWTAVPSLPWTPLGIPHSRKLKLASTAECLQGLWC